MSNDRKLISISLRWDLDGQESDEAPLCWERSISGCGDCPLRVDRDSKPSFCSLHDKRALRSGIPKWCPLRTMSISSQWVMFEEENGHEPDPSAPVRIDGPLVGFAICKHCGCLYKKGRVRRCPARVDP